MQYGHIRAVIIRRSVQSEVQAHIPLTAEKVGHGVYCGAVEQLVVLAE